MVPRLSLRGSIAAKLAVGYGLLVLAATAMLSAIVWIGTVGVFERSIDNKIQAIVARLVMAERLGGRAELLHQVEQQLHDRIDSDTEVVGVLDAGGQVLAGNLPRWSGALPPLGTLSLATLPREGGAPVSVRLQAASLDDGNLLLVGRDLSELDAIRGVVERALLISAAVSLLLAFAGAQLFRRQLEGRIHRIRGIAARIGEGELSSRIAVEGSDEFARLGEDVNRMLDRIESLMEGVRHVSNSIAHDLRTPLGRVRNRLDRALRAAGERGDQAAMLEDTRRAIEEIDGVISLFDKLLQIAAVEAGVRAESLQPLDLAAVARDMAELYEAVAEEQGMRLAFAGPAAGPVAAVTVRGDRHLLASALASLIDNALKYARDGGVVELAVRAEAGEALLSVRDRGPGVPAAELGKISERFYRVDRSRNLPGNGLGLSIVTAIARLHGGRLDLRDAAPGLEAAIVIPACAPER